MSLSVRPTTIHYSKDVYQCILYDKTNLLFTTPVGTISVFGRLHVETLESYTKKLANSVKMTSQAWEKEISFVLLQLINGLKSLQAQGIEEIEASLDQFLLIRADKDPHYR